MKDTADTITASVAVADLRRAMRLLRRSVERSVAIPVLRSARIVVAGDALTLSTTDLDVQISVTMPAVSAGDFAALVRFYALADFADVAYCRLDIHRAAKTTALRSAGLRVTVADVCEVRDFPGMAPADGSSVTIPAADLRHCLTLSRHAISKDETCYYLNGAYLARHPERQTLRVVTMDGRRMAVIDSAAEWPFDGFIVPTSAVDALIAILAGQTEATIRQSGCRMTVEAGPVTMTAKLIDGTYPDYSRVLPADRTESAHFTLPAGAIAAVTRAAEKLAGTPCAVFSPAKGEAVIGDGDASVRFEIQGRGNVKIGINARYLRDVCRAIGDVRCSISSPRDGVFVTGEDPDALFVVMPMHF